MLAFPRSSMGHMLTVCQIEKLIEIVYSMNDFLSVQPASRDPFTVGPQQHLDQLLSIVAVTRNGDYRFLPLLLSKVTEILPRLANPMLQNAPENSNMANIDIFDGFGNAGMAQPPPQMQMPMEDYDRKFPVEDYDKQYAMELQNGTPESSSNSTHSQVAPVPQNTDMNASFVSSPGLMSPGMDYSQNMNGFACTPMSEMVMSPMGNQSQVNPLSGGPSQHHHQQNQQHQPQHQQHLNSQQTSRPANINAPLSSPMNNAMYNVRQPPPRQPSFHLQHPPQMRTVGDFQGLQRGPADGGAMVGMAQMSSDVEFGGMR
jgi:hypothetical protein